MHTWARLRRTWQIPTLGCLSLWVLQPAYEIYYKFTWHWKLQCWCRSQICASRLSEFLPQYVHILHGSQQESEAFQAQPATNKGLFSVGNNCTSDTAWSNVSSHQMNQQHPSTKSLERCSRFWFCWRILSACVLKMKPRWSYLVDKDGEKWCDCQMFRSTRVFISSCQLLQGPAKPLLLLHAHGDYMPSESVRRAPVPVGQNTKTLLQKASETISSQSAATAFVLLRPLSHLHDRFCKRRTAWLSGSGHCATYNSCTIDIRASHVY